MLGLVCIMMLPIVAGGLTFVLSAQETERLRHSKHE
jgi:hypothetical protein